MNAFGDSGWLVQDLLDKLKCVHQNNSQIRGPLRVRVQSRLIDELIKRCVSNTFVTPQVHRVLIIRGGGF